jgi:hypothetical protein
VSSSIFGLVDEGHATPVGSWPLWAVLLRQ